MPGPILISAARVQYFSQLQKLLTNNATGQTGVFVDPDQALSTGYARENYQSIAANLWRKIEDGELSQKDIVAVFGETVETGELRAIAKALQTTGATEASAYNEVGNLFNDIARVSTRVSGRQEHFKAGLSILEIVGISKETIAWNPQVVKVVEAIGAVARDDTAPKYSFTGSRYQLDENAGAYSGLGIWDWERTPGLDYDTIKIGLHQGHGDILTGAVFPNLFTKPPQKTEGECEPSTFTNNTSAIELLHRFIARIDATLHEDGVPEAIRWLSPNYAQSQITEYFQERGFSNSASQQMADLATFKQNNRHSFHDNRLFVFNKAYTDSTSIGTPSFATEGVIESFGASLKLETEEGEAPPNMVLRIYLMHPTHSVFRTVWRTAYLTQSPGS